MKQGNKLAAAVMVALSLSSACVAQPAVSGIALVDDVGRTVRLSAPARRIVSLAPHITENLFAAGAGAAIVGAVDYSDFPVEAKKIPRVGSYVKLDLEAILALKPDLVIAWQSGNDPAQVERLKALGLPLFVNKPRLLDDVPGNIERFGELAGTTATAAPAARAYRARLGGLRSRHGGRVPVRTFFQVWNEPLTTVSGETLIGDVMRLCGAENIFAGLPVPAANVTVEAVLAADPEAIAGTGMSEANPEGLDMWKRWRPLAANARGNLFFIPPDIIDRHTPRILDGAQRLCEQMETARERRGKFGKPAGRL